MSAARSPGATSRARGPLRPGATAARFFSMRSANCRSTCRPSCCACCRRANSSRSAARGRARSMCEWSPPPIATWARWCAEGKFREDLFYRLNVFPLRVPPLRERGGGRGAAGAGVRRAVRPAHGPAHGRRCIRTMSRRLQEYAWPGNVRELQNVIERAIILSQGSRLDLHRALPAGAAPLPAPSAGSAGGLVATHPDGGGNRVTRARQSRARAGGCRRQNRRARRRRRDSGIAGFDCHLAHEGAGTSAQGGCRWTESGLNRLAARMGWMEERRIVA